MSSDINDEKLKIFEDITSNAKQIQENVLKEILALNANTEYLKNFLNRSSEKELFKKNIPMVRFFSPYIDRVANGEPSDIISGKLSEWIKDNDCRSSVSLILDGPNPELADLIEQECSQKSWKEIKVEIFDLVDVKLGCYYEPLVTNYSDLILTEFTCNADTSSSDHIGGHYVFYFEVKSKTNKTDLDLDNELLVVCCDVMEKSLDENYWKYRSKDVLIGALEIKVVQKGTFDSVMDIYISRGSSIAQYKTPICLKSPEALEVLENGVLVRAFSKE
ncbi:unnamed protein product [Cochlearia groenlandica]